MSLDSLTGSALIRLVIARQMKNSLKAQGHGKLWRMVHGLSESKLLKKRVLISNDFYSEDPFTCWWLFLNKPTTANDIIIKEVQGILMAHAMGGVANAMGGQVRSVHEACSQLSNTHKAMGVAKQTVSAKAMANKTYNKLNDAWQAGVWSAAKGTAQEFSLGFDQMLLGGCAHIEKNGKDLEINLRTWNNKSDMLSFMNFAESKGRYSEASRKYTRGLCSEIKYRYDARFGTLV
ncbi:hypothetical protein [Microbulbifer hainanensis]|uniref:hypothetical protein n=1 Tax=Microbulbifer hainanensis TaxID=2735675 RepID=UPI0018663DB8|nr:hypothetical protein [Microbulbifer hainanensis]